MEQNPSWEANRFSDNQEINRLFYGEGLLPSHPTPRLEDHSLSALHDCLFIRFGTTFRI